LLLTDNAAIAAYLEARFPRAGAARQHASGEGRDRELELADEFEGLLAIAESMRNSAPALANRALPGPMNYPQIPELAQRGRARLQHFFLELNDRLVGRDFVAADRFSIADITAVVAVDFARVVKVRPGEQHPHVQRWRAAMAERPSMSL
jgi:glutathione S-transferase